MILNDFHILGGWNHQSNVQSQRFREWTVSRLYLDELGLTSSMLPCANRLVFSNSSTFLLEMFAKWLFPNNDYRLKRPAAECCRIGWLKPGLRRSATCQSCWTSHGDSPRRRTCGSWGLLGRWAVRTPTTRVSYSWAILETYYEEPMGILYQLESIFFEKSIGGQPFFKKKSTSLKPFQ